MSPDRSRWEGVWRAKPDKHILDEQLAISCRGLRLSAKLQVGVLDRPLGARAQTPGTVLAASLETEGITRWDSPGARHTPVFSGPHRPSVADQTSARSRRRGEEARGVRAQCPGPSLSARRARRAAYSDAPRRLHRFDVEGMRRAARHCCEEQQAHEHPACWLGSLSTFVVAVKRPFTARVRARDHLLSAWPAPLRALRAHRERSTGAPLSVSTMLAGREAMLNTATTSLCSPLSRVLHIGKATSGARPTVEQR